MRILLGFMALFFLTSTNVLAQGPVKARKSPMASVSLTKGKTYMRVIYSQPSKRDREIFGGIVPFGKVWRTGANEATEIVLTQDVKINGKKLKAGTYSIFSIPDKKQWQVMFSSQLGLWGHYDYDSKKDVLKVKQKVAKTEQTWEAFTIKLEETSQGALMHLIWDQTKVSLEIEMLN